MGYHRSLFQRLAEVRIQEAKLLMDGSQWDGAYYLAGYAVECGLKSCIITKLFKDGHEFPEKRFSEKFFTHDLIQLRILAGLDAEMKQVRTVEDHWSIVKDWNESVRYNLGEAAEAERKANALFKAITDPSHGVLPWLKQRW